MNWLTFKVMCLAGWWWFSQHKSMNLTDLLVGVFSQFLFSLWGWEFYIFYINYIYIFLFFSPCSRLNRNKLQFLPELLFQSNPKLGRLWVHLSFFFPSLHPVILLHPTLPSLSSSITISLPVALSLPFFCLFWCVTWSIWKHSHGAMAELLSGLKVQVLRQVTQCCSVLLSRGEKECVSDVCACVCVHGFKRWKCAWSECFAWTREEFLFGNMEFSQSIRSVRTGHTDAVKPPSFSLFFISHSQTLSLSLSFNPIGVSTLSPFLPLCSLCLHSFFPLYYLSYPQRDSVRLGWRLKHLLNFIAVYIGLPSSKARGRLFVCSYVSLWCTLAFYCMCLQSLLSCRCVGAYAIVIYQHISMYACVCVVRC